MLAKNGQFVTVLSYIIASLKVDKKTDQFVSGFIPKPIIELCLLFYLQSEYFEKAADEMVVSGDEKNIVIKLSETWECYAFR